MDQATHNKIVSFIWGIADDVLRDLFKRGKYPDVILPMCVIRRMDAVLEPTKKTVLEIKKMLDEARITEQRAALCDAAGQAFYNTSKFTLRDLKSRGSQQQLLADFEAYLNGFSPNAHGRRGDAHRHRRQARPAPTHPRGHRDAALHVRDEDIRAALHEEFGDELFTRFSKVSAVLEKRLADLGNDEDEGDDEDGAAKKGLPEKKRKKLLDPKTWERDGRLVDVATKLRAALGETLFEDQYEPDSDLRDTEQVPLLEEGGIEAFIRREVLPYTPDAWIRQDATKIGYEVSFTRHFYKPQPLRTLEEISADILAIEKEAEGLLDGVLKAGAHA